MTWVAVAGMVLSLAAGDLPAWTFSSDLQGWTPNGHLANVAVKDGVLCADAVDWDPSFLMTGLNIEAKPWQYVVITMKADKPGPGELFWSGETTGQYGGLSQEKRTPFPVTGNNVMEDIVVFPFWQAEGTIRQLRLDVYNGAHFEIKSVRILQWGADTQPLTAVYTWAFAGDTSVWTVNPAARELFAPPLNLAVKDKGWVSLTLKSEKEVTGSILWSTVDGRGAQSADFTVRGGAEPRVCNVEMTGIPQWHDGVVALGIRLPKEGVRLESLTITDKPLGPPDLEVKYLGAGDALNRTGMHSRVIAQVVNNGGGMSDSYPARLVLSPDLRFAGGGPDQTLPSLAYGEMSTLTWTIMSQVASTHKVFLKAGQGKMAEGSIEVSKSILVDKAGYVPQPKPVKSCMDLCAFYFPGWDSDAKWDCIRRVAPTRKPVLGYYDESNPACVDWQIKWAVENGITCFLVDWYWVGGSQSLTHWFEAYRKAKYRDLLKVAIMWANHNPPDTHSPEDWRNVTKHWIEHYFNLPGYYRIDEKPAVFLWAPDNLRNDLKGSEAVKKSLDESQAMAREAGYPGIMFVAMNDNFAASNIQTLLQEGYSGITTYHEWGPEAPKAMAEKRMKYETVVKTAPQAWTQKNAAAGKLTYYPVVDTGWDSRPWHGDKSFVIEGRTPVLFEQLLDKARGFAADNEKKIVVVGPMNEWGEGSYIEPCLEFGFGMLEAIRTTFGRGNPKNWPVNAGPRDVGLGPYDFPPHTAVSAWTFDGPDPGWKAMMNVADVTCAEGKLKFRTTSTDPAIVAETYGLNASNFPKAVITMQLIGPIPEGAKAQLFWSPEGSTSSEATSVMIPLQTDGQPHTYTLDLKANPRWRNRIPSLRFDPCDTKDVQVLIDDIQLKP